MKSHANHTAAEPPGLEQETLREAAHEGITKARKAAATATPEGTNTMP